MRPAVLDRLWRIGRDVAVATFASRAELLLSFAVLAGWVLLTLGVAANFPARHVWPLSAGVFLLVVVAGLRPLGCIAWEGLSALTRDEDVDLAPRSAPRG